MKKWVNVSLIVLGLIVITIVAKLLFFSGPKIDYSCTTDDQCIIVKTSCCSCLSSSKDAKAINANSKEIWDEENACGLSICDQCENEEPIVNAACVNNKCKLI